MATCRVDGITDCRKRSVGRPGWDLRCGSNELPHCLLGGRPMGPVTRAPASSHSCFDGHAVMFKVGPLACSQQFTGTRRCQHWNILLTFIWASVGLFFYLLIILNGKQQFFSLQNKTINSPEKKNARLPQFLVLSIVLPMVKMLGFLSGPQDQRQIPSCWLLSTIFFFYNRTHHWTRSWPT